MTVTLLGEHRPRRPTWKCRCGAPWPCDEATELLLAEFADNPVRLDVYLHDLSLWAVYDLMDIGGGGEARGRILAVAGADR